MDEYKEFHEATQDINDLVETNERLRKIVEYALHLRQYGENAPGGNETWAKWDIMAENELRKEST